MQPSPDEIEAMLLQLPSEVRARLAATLLESLEAPSETDIAWLDEANRRSEELHAGGVVPRPAAEVFARVRASLNLD